MFERITEADINERSMANVSTTPGRKTAFGEGGLDAKALKLRFDRLGRYLAKRLNEVFDGLSEGNLAEVLYIDSNGERRSLKDFVESLLTGRVESIKIQTDDGILTFTELGNRTQDMYNGLATGDLASKIKIIDGVTLKSFYDEFLRLETEAAPVKSVNGKIGEVKLNAEDVGARPDNWMPTLEELDAEKAGSAANAVSGHNVQTDAHNDIRIELQRLAGIIADILDSDDATLNEMHEVVAYIKSNKALIEAVTTSKVNVADIINNLDTNVPDKPLSAAQGVVLNALISQKLDPSTLASAINTALAQAKESGDFDGEKGDKGDGLEIVTTTGTGKAYEATVNGITELKEGVSFVMVPHTSNTTSVVTLNVNGWGPKYLHRYTTDRKVMDWTPVGFFINRPYLVMYSTESWIVINYPKPSATDLYGVVPVANGGVPATSADNAGKVLTTNASGTPEWQEPTGGEVDTSALATVDKVKNIDTWVGGTEDLQHDDGVYWYERFAFYAEEGGGEVLGEGRISHRVPIIAGNNVTFTPTEDGHFIAINATGGGSSGDTIIDKTDCIDFWYGEKRDVNVDANSGNGVYWIESSAFLDEDEKELKSFTSNHRVPIVPGENVTFELDETNQVVKINATSSGFQGFHTNLYPMLCQSLAVPKAIQKANGELFYSINAYKAAGNTVLGDDLTFEDFVDLAMFGGSSQFNLEIVNNSDFYLKICIMVTWEELLDQITSRETIETLYIAPNSSKDLIVYPVEQEAADSQSWFYEILGARFTLNDYD